MPGFMIDTGMQRFIIEDHNSVKIEKSNGNKTLSIFHNENKKRIKIFERFLPSLEYKTDAFVYGISAPSCNLGCEMCFQNLEVHGSIAYSNLASASIRKIRNDIKVLSEAGKRICISIYNNEFFERRSIMWQKELINICTEYKDNIETFRVHTALKDIDSVTEYPFYDFVKNILGDNTKVTITIAAKMNPDNNVSNHYYISDPELVKKVKRLNSDLPGVAQFNLLCDPTKEIFGDSEIEEIFKIISEIKATCEISTIFQSEDYSIEKIKYDLIFQFMRISSKYFVFVKGRDCEVYSMYKHLVPINVTGPPMFDTLSEQGKILHHYSGEVFPFTTAEEIAYAESKAIHLEHPKLKDGVFILEKETCISCPAVGACSKGYCKTFHCNNELFTILACFAVKCSIASSIYEKHQFLNLNELFDSIVLSNEYLNMYFRNVKL